MCVGCGEQTRQEPGGAKEGLDLWALDRTSLTLPFSSSPKLMSVFYVVLN